MPRRMRRPLLAACAVLFMAAPAGAEQGYGDSAPFALNTDAISGVAEDPALPRVNRLDPCRPNPFNPVTTITYALADRSVVHLAIYDLRGRLVRTLVAAETLPAGAHEITWNGRDDRGALAAGGVYVYRLRTAEFVASRRMTLVK
jgi:hypothetical protein